MGLWRRGPGVLEAMDDRERRVRLYVPGRLELLLGAPPGFQRAEFAQVRRKIVGPLGPAMGVAALAWILILVPLSFRAVGSALRGDWVRALAQAEFIVAGAVGLEILFRGYGRPNRGDPGWGARVREALLAAERCASCSYPLGGARAQEDGCTVCPECSAAWRLPVGPDQRGGVLAR